MNATQSKNFEVGGSNSDNETNKSDSIVSLAQSIFVESVEKPTKVKSLGNERNNEATVEKISCVQWNFTESDEEPLISKLAESNFGSKRSKIGGSSNDKNAMTSNRANSASSGSVTNKLSEASGTKIASTQHNSPIVTGNKRIQIYSNEFLEEHEISECNLKHLKMANKRADEIGLLLSKSNDGYIAAIQKCTEQNKKLEEAITNLERYCSQIKRNMVAAFAGFISPVISDNITSDTVIEFMASIQASIETGNAAKEIIANLNFKC